MAIIIGNKLHSLGQWLTKKRDNQRIMKLAELFFFSLPTLFLFYHYLMAVLSGQDFFHLLVSNPRYTIQFMTYASYYFVSLLFRLLGRLVNKPQESSLVKVVLLLTLVSQLLSLNLVVTAVVLMVSRQLFQREMLRINIRDVFASQQKVLLVLASCILLVSGLLALMTAVLS